VILKRFIHSVFGTLFLLSKFTVAAVAAPSLLLREGVTRRVAEGLELFSLCSSVPRYHHVISGSVFISVYICLMQLQPTSSRCYTGGLLLKRRRRVLQTAASVGFCSVPTVDLSAAKPCKVSKGLVGFCHAVHVFALLNGSALLVVGIHNFGCKAFCHAHAFFGL